ncbi:FAD-dependent oxidoreductase [Streptomyces sp. NPDC001982]|uniref:FAD-dependent oxidoreductase n=1 Tax=Streptomyces sp. NPDC001982 TaxID=3154405 RepID=UPI00332C4885
MEECSVLVVGAGPVGLATANELGLRGQDVLVLEAGDGVIDHPRAGGLSIRTMEFCRRWGIIDEVRNCGFPADYDLDIVFSTGLNGYDLIRERYPSIGQMPVPEESPERRQRCPQMWFDPIMARAAARHDSVRLQHHHEVTELTVAGDGTVHAWVRDVRGGSTHEVRARYAVACDGASSRVRESLGIGTSGIPLLNYSIGVFFRSPGLLAITGHRPAARFIFISPDGPVGNLTVVDGKDLWRFTYIAGTERPDLSTLDVEGTMRRVLGDKAKIEILSIAPWRRSQLVADAFRAGPVFLAGDSAHTMSPTGGFGSNTGIGEAVDLGWKLDAVLRGWGGPGLLDSYEAERRPIALRNTQAATSNFRGWYSTADLSRLLEPGEEGDRLRRSVGEELVEGTRAEWESKGVILGYRYENSPVIVPDGSPEPPDDYRVYEPTNRPGHRAPHAWLAEGCSTLDLFGDGFVLLDTGSADDLGDITPLVDAARLQGVPLRREALPSGLEHLYFTRLTLVRPDGHVAWRGDVPPAEPAALLRVVTGHSAA